MKTTAKWLVANSKLLFLLSLATCHLPLLFGQTVGVITPATSTAPVFSAVNAPTISANFSNLGQPVQYLSYTTSGSVQTLALQLEGSPDGIHWFRISETGTNPVNGVVYATVYLPLIRANLTDFVGPGASLTAARGSTSISGGGPFGSFVRTVKRQKLLAAAVPANVTKTFTVLPADDAVSPAIVFVKLSDVLAGASITITSGPSVATQNVILNAVPLAATAAQQIVTLPANVGNVVQVTFNSPGATPVTVDITVQIGAVSPSSATVQNMARQDRLETVIERSRRIGGF